eukprot:3156389-Rhodomonas_salina.1
MAEAGVPGESRARFPLPFPAPPPCWPCRGSSGEGVGVGEAGSFSVDPPFEQGGDPGALVVGIPPAPTPTLTAPGPSAAPSSVSVIPATPAARLPW